MAHYAMGQSTPTADSDCAGKGQPLPSRFGASRHAISALLSSGGNAKIAVGVETQPLAKARG